MTRILVTGRTGQVSTALQKLSAADSRGPQIFAVGRPETDIANEADVRRAIAEHRPDVVVNAAAYTAVDQAEDEPDLAHAVNALGAGHVARASAALGIPIIQLSTDYVYSGRKPEHYVEDDETGPLGVYGRTKLAGEDAVRRENPRHVILRTAWVYSAYGKNFLKTMLRLAADRDSLKIVSDQYGNPTQADDIAAAILHISNQLMADGGNAPYGLYHLAGSGETNWADFARAIFAESAKRSGPTAHVEGITTAEYPTRAVRPANSRLDTSRLKHAFGIAMPSWQDGVARSVAQLI